MRWRIDKLFWQTCSQIFPFMRAAQNLLSSYLNACQNAGIYHMPGRGVSPVRQTGRAENTHLHSRVMRAQPARAGRAAGQSRCRAGPVMWPVCDKACMCVCPVSDAVALSCSQLCRHRAWRSDRQPTTDVIIIHNDAIKYPLTCLWSLSLCVCSISIKATSLRDLEINQCVWIKRFTYFWKF